MKIFQNSKNKIKKIQQTRNLINTQQQYFSKIENEDSKVQHMHHSDKVFEFKLNSPKTLNSIDTEMVNLMLQRLNKWSKDQSYPKVVLIQGVGDKAFCAGGDIKNIYEAEMGTVPKHFKAKFFADEYLLDYTLASLPRSTLVCIWNGIVMGGGVGISVHSPIRIACESSVFAMPETGIGFFTDVGGSYFLPRIKNNISLGLFLGLTGYRLKAQDLLTYGVASHYVEKDKIESLKKEIVNQKNESISDVQAIVQQFGVQEHSDKIKNLDEICDIFQPDSIQDIVKRLQNSNTEFAQKNLKLLQKMSPISLNIVFEQIKRGSQMKLKDVFEMEYKISQGFMNHREFFEGVRALLIDKDKNPQWTHKSVFDIKKEEVDFFFDRSETLNLDITKY